MGRSATNPGKQTRFETQRNAVKLRQGDGWQQMKGVNAG